MKGPSSEYASLDLITIISILCDTMLLEATVIANKAKLSIAIFKMENQSVIVGENSAVEGFY